jgi:hypothetical protein
MTSSVTNENILSFLLSYLYMLCDLLQRTANTSCHKQHGHHPAPALPQADKGHQVVVGVVPQVHGKSSSSLTTLAFTANARHHLHWPWSVLRIAHTPTHPTLVPLNYIHISMVEISSGVGFPLDLIRYLQYRGRCSHSIVSAHGQLILKYDYLEIISSTQTHEPTLEKLFCQKQFKI